MKTELLQERIDALIREGKVALQPLPLILGSALSGIVYEFGAGVSGFKLGDEVYGATNVESEERVQLQRPHC